MKPYAEYRAIQEQVLEYARSKGHTNGNEYVFAFGFIFAGLMDDQLDDLAVMTKHLEEKSGL